MWSRSFPAKNGHAELPESRESHSFIKAGSSAAELAAFREFGITFFVAEILGFAFIESDWFGSRTYLGNTVRKIKLAFFCFFLNNHLEM